MLKLILREKFNGYLPHRLSGKQENFILPFLVADEGEFGMTLAIIVQKRRIFPAAFIAPALEIFQFNQYAKLAEVFQA